MYRFPLMRNILTFFAIVNFSFVLICFPYEMNIIDVAILILSGIQLNNLKVTVPCCRSHTGSVNTGYTDPVVTD